MRGHSSEGRLGARVPGAVCESDAAPAAREKAKKKRVIQERPSDAT